MSGVTVQTMMVSISLPERLDWASTAASSFLTTPEETRASLEDNHFTVEWMVDNVAESREFGARSRKLVEEGHKPPFRAIQLMHGDKAPAATANAVKGAQQGAIIPIEVYCVRRNQ